MAQAGQDQQVQAHVLGSLSHLAHHMGQPDRAAVYARQGTEQLSGQGHPGLKARLIAMQARSLAAARDSQRCAERLRSAERTLALPSGDEPSPWVSTFDEASLATEVARCFRDLGQLGTARVQAERVMQLRSADRARSRAFACLMLCSVAVAQGRLDEACLLGREVLDTTRTLGSSLVLRQLEELRESLAPYGRSRTVAAFLAHLDAELRERHRPAQWLPPLAAESPGTEMPRG